MSESNLLGLSVSLNVVLFVFLTLVAGTMAGLIICTFSLDGNRLRGLAQGNNVKDAQKAEKLLRILQEPHWVLITFLIWNDIALEMMPLLLDAILNPILAIIVSVLVTLVFCELIPQVFFLHNAFEVCAFLSPVVIVLMYLCSPISWPIGKLLDYLVGDKEIVPFQRRELKALLSYQEELRERKRTAKEESIRTNTQISSDEDDLEKEEMSIMLNIISLSESKAKNMIQTPISDMYKLHSSAFITRDVVETIFRNGYRFVLVYEEDPNNVESFFLTNVLALMIYRSEEHSIRVCDLQLISLCRMSGEISGTELFIGLQRLSPAIVLIVEDDERKTPAGILTLEDVNELIHQTAFKAEMDPTNESPMQLMMHSWKLFQRYEEDGSDGIPSMADNMRALAMSNESMTLCSSPQQKIC